jgi:hypothetical protein
MPTCTCYNCGKSFTRYAMNATRASKPQYCSKKCLDESLKIKADNNFENRFFSRIKKGGPDECWEWTGRVNKTGYGLFDIGRFPRLAHRVAFRIANGYEAFNACHSCDNPPCCNPAHLWDGTPKLNSEDRERKKRTRRPPPLKGKSNPAAKLTEEQAMYILQSRETGTELAKMFGISKTAVYKIKNGQNWSYLQEKKNA